MILGRCQISKEAIKLALEALGNSWTEPGNKQYEFEKEAIAALREALAEQPAQQEPVGDITCWTVKGNLKNTDFDYYGNLPDGTHLLYTTPPQRKPLMRQHINQMMADAGWQNSAIRQADLDKVEKVARAIETAHGIKENT